MQDKYDCRGNIFSNQKASPSHTKNSMPEEKKSERVTIWISPKLKRKLAREAKRKGLTLSNYAGDILTTERLVYMVEADRDQLLSTRLHLFKIGANYDRMASALERLAKSQDDANPPQLDWLKETSEQLRQSLIKLDQELSIIRPFRPED